MRGHQAFMSLAGALAVAACAGDQYALAHTPNYDHLIGKRFSEAIPPPGNTGFKRVSESAEVEEVADRRPDGCTTTFGVRKADGTIAYWRVAPSPEQCKVRHEPLNR